MVWCRTGGVLTMKKLVRIIICFISWIIVMSNNVFAMTFSNPIQIGKFIYLRSSFEFQNVNSNLGQEIYSSKNSRKLYEKGTASFGYGNDALYMHYKAGTQSHGFQDATMAFGTMDISNTIDLQNIILYQVTLYKIGTDQNIVFYLIQDEFDWPGVSDYALIGKREDGVFVKYFDTNTIKETYFGKNWSNIGFENVKYMNDTLILDYGSIFDGKTIGQGEFRFKWDDKAQWFGVEQVVY